jgi:DegV family protein with EDD domain
MEGEKMKKICIVTDNTCNLKDEELKRLEVRDVSLYVVRNDKYEKAKELNLEKFYEFIKTTPYIPQTSQPSVNDFEVVYREVLENYDEIISIHISEKLSGTCNSARLAATIVDPEKIHVVDTKLTSMGLGFMIRDLKDMINKGETDSKVLIDYSYSYYNKVNVFMTVGNLNYLHKGGRIGKAQAFMGGLLKVKPILYLKEGEIGPEKKVRGAQKLISELADVSLNYNGDLSHLAILHTGNFEIANEVVKEFENRGIDKSLIEIDYMDAVIGTHLGPDSVGVILRYN